MKTNQLSKRQDIEEQLRCIWDERDYDLAQEAKDRAEIEASDRAGLDAYYDSIFYDDESYWADMEYEREEAERKFEADERMWDEIYYRDLY